MKADNERVTLDSNGERSLRDQVWSALDPTGGTRALMQAADAVEVADWTRLVSQDLDSGWRSLRSVGREYRQLVRDMEGAFEHLVPRGWAVMLMQTEAVNVATGLVRAGDGDRADALLAGQWTEEGSWRSKRVCDRVRTMGAGDNELRELFGHRSRLLHKARAHHEAGRFDASIPILQAQIEGIVMDVCGGRKFFTKGTQKANLIDPTQLVSIEAGLAALRATQGADVIRTQAEGSLSRHGIAHGRELAYDTEVNSAKTWSVIDAVVEWAMPKARELVELRRAERWAENAGRTDTDESGRRVDDREFAVTRDMLRQLAGSANGWRRRLGLWRPDVVGGAYTDEDFRKRGLPGLEGVTQQVSADGLEVAFWRVTVSSWVLGIAVRPAGDSYTEFYYSAATPPKGCPGDAPAGWALDGGTPPDWR